MRALLGIWRDKMKKLLTLFAASIVLMLTLIGCGGSDQALVGTWQLYDTSAREEFREQQPEMDIGDLPEILMTFNQGGTGQTNYSVPWSEAGPNFDWEVANDVLTITFDGDIIWMTQDNDPTVLQVTYEVDRDGILWLYPVDQDIWEAWILVE